MSNLTKSEREGLNDLFCYLEVSNFPIHKRILLKINRLLIFIKLYIIR
ncbi:hypothetical protein SAMN05216234_104104 [Hydrogenimonas thermophila]|uniref:Uncharacterized protein n=1 Tax=Hydrogenimonas thermophila TaxID=223786 RepID=A0A1I5LZQ6_9BACT|nr:hypothetical protein SAMN05216234_104104 [Hydrogenimonas thermophila]